MLVCDRFFGFLLRNTAKVCVCVCVCVYVCLVREALFYEEKLAGNNSEEILNTAYDKTSLFLSRYFVQCGFIIGAKTRIQRRLTRPFRRTGDKAALRGDLAEQDVCAWISTLCCSFRG